MSLRLQFFGFVPDDDLIANANRSIERLIDLSPYGLVPVALLEKTKEGFRCAIDLYTMRGPLVAHSYQDTPSQALEKVCEVLQEKLSRWTTARPRHLSEQARRFRL
jgi:ribosome-associated translation inhibitor RaiA